MTQPVSSSWFCFSCCSQPEEIEEKKAPPTNTTPCNPAKSSIQTMDEEDDQTGFEYTSLSGYHTGSDEN